MKNISCQSVKQQLNSAILLGFSSVFLSFEEITTQALEDLKECGFKIIKKKEEEGLYYTISY